MYVYFDRPRQGRRLQRFWRWGTIRSTCCTHGRFTPPNYFPLPNYPLGAASLWGTSSGQRSLQLSNLEPGTVCIIRVPEIFSKALYGTLWKRTFQYLKALWIPITPSITTRVVKTPRHRSHPFLALWQFPIVQCALERVSSTHAFFERASC